MIRQILVKDESSEYDLSYKVYSRCPHWQTKIERVELDNDTYDDWLRCSSCGLVLETLSDLRSIDYDCD